MASYNLYSRRMKLLQNTEHWEHDIKPHQQVSVHTCQHVNENTTVSLPETRRLSDEVVFKKYVATAVSWVSLVTEHLLSHPFIVLRRQCQVNHMSKKYHLTPVTLIPIVVHLHQRQGITILWKGLGSMLLIRGMTLGIEDILSKLMPWPKEVNITTSVKMFFRHIMLKCVSLAIVTPFYSASLVETVQSNIASENPGFLDVFKEGAIRFVNWGIGHRGRSLPIWALILPTMTLGLARYLYCIAVQGSATKLLQVHDKVERSYDVPSKDIVNYCCADSYDISAMFISIISTDVLFFPFETVLHRLHLQGTRTIVDNLDTGYSVLPILTNYEGSFDCYEKILSLEGTTGLYKGFGAMVLQYAVHIMLVRTTKVLLIEFSNIMRTIPTNTSTSPSVIYPEELQSYANAVL